ncbi:hypothetical protein K470DRAFT_74418 [Piedraia hortae CBS 480.64]|uniref:Uncharacterized protein n=1 Tax=Piedraia hortae CBS 480.64 TaxID=1314780 RepID=A0A6A7C078_9PEZI|nr:hypothetical protein K470DRAFT_74418 [Piedraia hortae CBS 480.64]
MAHRATARYQSPAFTLHFLFYHFSVLPLHSHIILVVTCDATLDRLTLHCTQRRSSTGLTFCSGAVDSETLYFVSHLGTKRKSALVAFSLVVTSEIPALDAKPGGCLCLSGFDVAEGSCHIQRGSSSHNGASASLPSRVDVQHVILLEYLLLCHL